MSPLAAPAAVLTRPDDSKEVAYRLQKFMDWLEATDRSWTTPDLSAYTRALLDTGLKPKSVASLVSTVRGRYHELLRDPAQLTRFVGESAELEALRRQLQAGIYTERGLLSYSRAPATDHRLLDDWDLAELVRQPSGATLMDLRDRAVLALLVATGCRETELVRVDVADLESRLLGVPAVRLQMGRGAGERLTPYLRRQIHPAVDHWVRAAGLAKDEALFYGFYRGGNVRRPQRMSLRTVHAILTQYPLWLAGEDAPVVMTSSDIRASYAWHMQRAGHEIPAIAQWMGASVAQIQAYLPQ